jgi:L-idonate 5-dehydrogenase
MMTNRGKRFVAIAAPDKRQAKSFKEEFYGRYLAAPLQPETGKFGSAGLDVSEGKPNLIPRFLELPDVLLQPHSASDTVERRKAKAKLVRDKLAAHFANAPVLTPSCKVAVMKAVVIHAAKDLRVEEREIETLQPGQVEVAVEAGGICGSDLHYYNHGGFGTVRVREPMILGHEVAGTIKALGQGVSQLAIGDRVAVSPSRPCNTCEYCLRGEQNHCLNMRFYGSAMPMPHIQGAFRERLVAEAWQCHKVAHGVSINEAAMAEPFAVALHAVNRAGPLTGKRVLVTGCGPIGALAVIAARAQGAREIVATDMTETVLRKALEIGADRVINVGERPEELSSYSANKGYFDVQFEASGNERAVRSGLEVLRPRATLVQIGLGGDVSIPQNMIVAKEIEIKGTFRFHEEFGLAVDFINNKRVNLKPLFSGSYPLEDAIAAFEAAGDRSRSMKIQLAF